VTSRLTITEESMERDGEVWSLIRVSGEPRGFNSEELAGVLKRLCATPGFRVWLTFEDARHMDSTSIGVVLSAYSKARDLKGTFRVQLLPDTERFLRKLFGPGYDDWIVGALPVGRPPANPGPKSG
jgi:anti-anti-sigma factor